MISKNVIDYCCEDPSLIENYDKAINDNSEIWECHHRLETDKHMSKEQLQDQNLYLNRPACELIFLTKSDHSRLHAINVKEETNRKRSETLKGTKHSNESYRQQSISLKIKYNNGYINPMYGKRQSEESNRKRSKSMTGRQHSSKGKHRVYDNEERTKYHYE